MFAEFGLFAVRQVSVYFSWPGMSQDNEALGYQMFGY